MNVLVKQALPEVGATASMVRVVRRRRGGASPICDAVTCLGPVGIRGAARSPPVKSAWQLARIRSAWSTGVYRRRRPRGPEPRDNVFCPAVMMIRALIPARRNSIAKHRGSQGETGRAARYMAPIDRTRGSLGGPRACMHFGQAVNHSSHYRVRPLARSLRWRSPPQKVASSAALPARRRSRSASRDCVASRSGRPTFRPSMRQRADLAIRPRMHDTTIPTGWGFDETGPSATPPCVTTARETATLSYGSRRLGPRSAGPERSTTRRRSGCTQHRPDDQASRWILREQWRLGTAGRATARFSPARRDELTDGGLTADTSTHNLPALRRRRVGKGRGNRTCPPSNPSLSIRRRHSRHRWQDFNDQVGRGRPRRLH